MENVPETEECIQELIRCVYDCQNNRVPIMVVHAFIGFEEHSPNEIGLRNFEKGVKEAENCGVKIAFEKMEFAEYLAKYLSVFTKLQRLK